MKKPALHIVSSELREPPPQPPRVTPAPAAHVAADSAPAVLEPPEDLDDARRAQWVRIVTCAPHLTDADRHLVEVLVDAIVLHQDAAKNVRTIGPLIKSSKGVPMQNPYLPVKNKQAALIARYSSELGLSPQARKRGNFKAKAPAKGYSAFAHLKDRTAFD